MPYDQLFCVVTKFALSLYKDCGDVHIITGGRTDRQTDRGWIHIHAGRESELPAYAHTQSHLLYFKSTCAQGRYVSVQVIDSGCSTCYHECIIVYLCLVASQEFL